jgi:hypothetical protein
VSSKSLNANITESITRLTEFDQAVGRNLPLCDGAYDYRPTVYESAYGRSYPLAMLLGFDVLLKTAVTFEYEVTSKYNSQLPSSAIANRGVAQPWVDFIPIEKASFTLNPGEIGCPIFVEILDDSLVEERESFLVNVLSVSGISGGYENIGGVVSINDNEPALTPFSGEFLLNRGESASVQLSLSRAPLKDTQVAIVLNELLTTASDREYAITPENRVVTFPAGQKEAVLTVRADELDGVYAQDRRVVIKDVLSNQRSDEAVSVSINQWEADVVLSASPALEFVDVAPALSGSIFTIANFTSGPDTKVLLQAFDSHGSLVKLNNTQGYEIFRPGAVIEAKGIYTNTISAGTEIYIFLEVSGNFGGVQWGGKDFGVLRLLVSSDGSVSEVGVSQHGSEQDDSVTDLYMSDGSGIFVSGFTTGKTLDGAASIAPNGGQDAFIYSFSQDLSSTNWARFIGGDSSATSVSGVAANSSNATVLLSDGRDAIVKTLDNSRNSIGSDDFDLESVDINYARSVNWSSISNDGQGAYIMLGDSLADLQSGDPITDSLSRDAYIVSLRVDGASTAPVSVAIASPADDEAVDMAQLFGEKVGAIVGNTAGQFPLGKQQINSADLDAFITTFDFASGVQLNDTVQFGTPGDDFVIDVEPSGDNKFLVLWKENHTSGDGSFRYRISAFSKDGRKLTPDI